MKFFLASSLLGPVIKVLIVMWSGLNVSFSPLHSPCNGKRQHLHPCLFPKSFFLQPAVEYLYNSTKN